MVLFRKKRKRKKQNLLHNYSCVRFVILLRIKIFESKHFVRPVKHQTDTIPEWNN